MKGDNDVMWPSNTARFSGSNAAMILLPFHGN